MRSFPRALLAGGLGFAVSLVVAACGGGSGLLPSDQAGTINGQLDQISSALQSGNCARVSSGTVNLAQVVANLPPTVNPRLRNNINEGVSTVGQLANRDCRQAPPAATPKTTTSTSSSTATATQSTPTQTATTPATHSTPAPTTASTPATTPSSPGTTSTGSGGAGLGGANGNGNANTGGAGAGNGNGG